MHWRQVLLLAASIVAASTTDKDGILASPAAHDRQSYIVTFKDGTDPLVQHEILEGVLRAGGSIAHRYTTVLLGFAGAIPEAHVATLRQHTAVEDIEIDHEVRAV